jgi:hypothetical protein
MQQYQTHKHLQPNISYIFLTTDGTFFIKPEEARSIFTYLVHLDAPRKKSTHHRKAPNELLIMDRRPLKALRNMVSATKVLICKQTQQKPSEP